MGKVSKIVIRLFLILITIWFVYPIIWNVFASLKTNTEILESPWSLPTSLHFENFVRAFTKAHMGEYIFNSIFVTVFSMILMLIITIPTAYAIARFNFFGKKFLHNFYMAGLFIEPLYILVPLFMLMSDMHMLDNLFWLSVVYAVGHVPFSVYLLIGFLKTIPKEYEESASIDGCGYFSTLIRIILPIAKPGILTVVIFQFFAFWNEYALALVLIQTDAKKTIPVGLANLMEVQRFATDWGALFAALVIVLVPTIVLYALTQKKLTEGMTMGGIKG
ncbi:carbohydrate ABC transporter permease [Virgibacillus necropolis]|uniref:carbohydrate ABC transporter permease n=1 Tax=Virgibacillus necropolis TaxID=163877 RepID=UPI00384C5B10